jgi:hypothetical protein
MKSATTQAEEIAHLIATDVVAAAQIKKFLKPAELFNLLDLQLEELDLQPSLDFEEGYEQGYQHGRRMGDIRPQKVDDNILL